MKRIIEILAILAVAASIAALTSCGSSEETAAQPEPHEVLEEQVSQERQLRHEADFRAQTAASKQRFWEAVGTVALIGVCIAFIFGTAIGSKGRSDAS